MNKLCLLVCLLVSVAATAQTAPKVVFVTDQALTDWLSSPSFTVNTNWVGAPIENDREDYSQALQAVINQHPDYMFIDVGTYDMLFPIGSIPGPGIDALFTEDTIEYIVETAQAAKIKVILGNVLILDSNYAGDLINLWIQNYGATNNIPVVNFDTRLNRGCYGTTCNLATVGPLGSLVPTPQGSQFMTQIAQIAVATYGLTIKGGYLADVEIDDGTNGEDYFSPTAQVNSVGPGAVIQFTPQATWSDGVTRPMLNFPWGDGEAQGTWWSTNPNVLLVNQHGRAYSYQPPTCDECANVTAQIWFKSATGQTFSPWGMTVGSSEF